jgi:hypothetical protein
MGYAGHANRTPLQWFSTDTRRSLRRFLASSRPVYRESAAITAGCHTPDPLSRSALAYSPNTANVGDETAIVWTSRTNIGAISGTRRRNVNLARRHMTTEQKAALGAEIKDYEAQAARERQSHGQTGPGKNAGGNIATSVKGKARDSAGDKVGVSGRTIDDADKIRKSAQLTHRQALAHCPAARGRCRR